MCNERKNFDADVVAVTMTKLHYGKERRQQLVPDEKLQHLLQGKKLKWGSYLFRLVIKNKKH